MEDAMRDQVAKTIFGTHLSSENLSQLLSQATIIHLSGGEFLFREGERDDRVFLLLDGQVDLAMTVPGRGLVRVLSLGAGEIIAWSSILGDGLMTCSAVCTKPAALLSVDCEQLRMAIETNQRFGYEFMNMMASALARRLLATRLQLLDLFEAGSAGRSAMMPHQQVT